MAVEFFIKNLCAEILQTARREDIECHQNFILYYLTLLAYDPIWNLHPKMKEINRIDALRLINYVITKMRNQHCPCIIALKMQFYFHCNFKPKEEIVELEKSNFHVRLRPLIDDIVESVPEKPSDYDLLFKKIIYYCMLWKGLGNPTIEPVYREAYFAMLSIMDQSDLQKFVQLDEEDKPHELDDYANICAGVRIFNWATKKASEGVEDLPILFVQLLNSCKQDATNKLAGYLNKLDILTTALDLCFVIEQTVVVKDDGDEGIEYVQSCIVPEGIEYDEIENFKDNVIVFRELEGFVRKLLNTIDELEMNYENINVLFNECLEKFHNLAFLNAGVPTYIIFPLFFELDKLWELYHEVIIYVRKMQDILQNLELYIKDCNINYDRLETIIGYGEVLTDQERLQVHGSTSLEEEMNDLHVITPQSDKFDLDNITLEFLGFDLWRLVESQGALIPGNPNLGILVFDDKYYAFSCYNSAFMFSLHPQRCLNEGLELARKRSELIPLLSLEQRLSEVQTIKQLVLDQKTTESNVALSNAMIQTDTHAPKVVDKIYMWNIWDYKREALLLANIAKQKTHSTETKSGTNLCASTQTQKMVDVASQTKRDCYTNTHRPLTYFFGLRGRKDDKQFILDLTRPPQK